MTRPAPLASPAIELRGRIVRDTHRDVLFEPEGPRQGRVWLSKAWADVAPAGAGIAVVTLPRAMADELGLSEVAHG